MSEIEGRYIHQSFSIDHYATVKLQIYRMDMEEVVFENHCTFEQLPKKFAVGVEMAVQDYLSEHNIADIQVCLLDGNWHEYDSSERDFYIATLLALFEIFSSKNKTN